MVKGWMAGALFGLAALPGIAPAQEGVRFDCVVTSIAPDLKASIGSAMSGGGDDASREALFTQLAATADDCVKRHGITEDQKGAYFDYSLARIAREWLVTDLARFDLAPSVIDKALDFGPNGANPDLSADMTEDQIMAIVQAYIDSGVDIEKIDGAAWEKVGSYAAATSIYWNKRKQLPF